MFDEVEGKLDCGKKTGATGFDGCFDIVGAKPDEIDLPLTSRPVNGFVSPARGKNLIQLFFVANIVELIKINIVGFEIFKAVHYVFSSTF